MPPLSFIVRTEVYYGTGALQQLASLGARRAFLVTDRQMVALGYADRVSRLLAGQGAAVATFDGVEPDPSQETCAAGAALAAEFSPDTIVGLGGGSAMDAAKAVWTLVENPGCSLADLIADRERALARKQRRMIAISTTSGTGSEVSRGGVITNRSATPAVKQILMSGQPDVAIVDPELHAGMPPQVTADTGVDVLTHALESLAHLADTQIVDAVALQAVRTTFDWLPKAVANGRDMVAREKMAVAATMGGIAMLSGLGVVHATAHQLGAVFGIPHGRANSLMLTHSIPFNFGVVGHRYAMVARAVGIAGPLDDDQTATSRLIEAIEGLQRTVGLPPSIQAAGIPEADFFANLDAVSANAGRDRQASVNPRPATAEDARALFLAAWAGMPARV